MKKETDAHVPQYLQDRYYLPSTLDVDLLAAARSMYEVRKTTEENIVGLLRYVFDYLLAGERLADIDWCIIRLLKSSDHDLPIKVLQDRSDMIGMRTATIVIAANPVFSPNNFGWALALIRGAKRRSPSWWNAVKIARGCALQFKSEQDQISAAREIGSLTKFKRDFAPALKQMRSKTGSERFFLCRRLIEEGAPISLQEAEAMVNGIELDERIVRQNAFLFLSENSAGDDRIRLYLQSIREIMEDQYASRDPDYLSGYIEILARMRTEWSLALIDKILGFMEDGYGKVLTLMTVYEQTAIEKYLRDARLLAGSLPEMESRYFALGAVSSVTGDHNDLRLLIKTSRVFKGIKNCPVDAGMIHRDIYEALMAGKNYDKATCFLLELRDQEERDLYLVDNLTARGYEAFPGLKYVAHIFLISDAAMRFDAAMLHAESGRFNLRDMIEDCEPVDQFARYLRFYCYRTKRQ
jgi:hypothetical protein